MLPIFAKLLKSARRNIKRPRGRAKHFAFIVRKNQILSLGFNDCNKTHTISHKYGYWNCSIHAELSAILNFKPALRELKKCRLINIRLGRKTREACMSKPCRYCQELLKEYEFREVWYTTAEGRFVKM